MKETRKKQQNASGNNKRKSANGRDSNVHYQQMGYVDPDDNGKKKKKKTAGDLVLTLILIAAIGVFGYAAFNLFHIYTEYKKGSDEYNDIAQMAVTERDPDAPVKTEEEPAAAAVSSLKAPMTIDFASLKEINDDVIGWIYIEALDGVSYPVVRGIDNSYYLHMTYKKNYNFAGTIFMDCENHDDFSDCNTILYGHNMKNGSMFGQLKKFSENTDAYDKSKYIWVFTPDADYRYEIISAYTAPVNSFTYTLFKGPGQEFVDYMQKILEQSDIQTDPGQLTVGDRILTLSTCTGNEATRFVVQAKRIDTIKHGGTTQETPADAPVVVEKLDVT